MNQFLIHRPVAVIMSFLAIALFSIYSFFQLPVSLLPSIDVPQIIVKAEFVNASPQEMEQNILRTIRQHLSGLSGLKEVQSTASNETGRVKLVFSFDQPMDLAYIAVNEKIDQLAHHFPQGMPRPQVVRVNTADIPVVRLHITPQNGQSLLETSRFVENFLKKRIEQLEEVSLVDGNGFSNLSISVIPNQAFLKAYHLSNEDISRAIQSQNQILGTISVKDGHYRYYLQVKNNIYTAEDVKNIHLITPSGDVLKLAQIAKIREEAWKTESFHMFNKQPGIVLTIHKRPGAKLSQLNEKIEELLQTFSAQYDGFAFSTSQNQSSFLEAAFNHLTGSLVIGGLIAFGVLFLFMGDYRIAVVIGLSLPVSVVLSFFFLHLAGLSLNIISLSGLALGIGMLIDNAIIVSDNINQKRISGLTLAESCMKGVQEVRGALISSVLTTLAVFIPLIFLNDLSGALFYEQALALAIILFVSLFVSFILLPTIFMLIFRDETYKLSEDSRLYTKTSEFFTNAHHWLSSRPKISLALLLILLAAGLFAGSDLKIKGMPEVETDDMILKVKWNEPIGIEENRRRILHLLEHFSAHYLLTDSDIGKQQYLHATTEQARDKASVYFQLKEAKNKQVFRSKLVHFFRKRFPKANLELINAPNAFNQLFNEDSPFFEARWHSNSYNRTGNIDPEFFAEVQNGSRSGVFKEMLTGPAMTKTSVAQLKINQEALALYQIPFSRLQQKLKEEFGVFTITELKYFRKAVPVVFKENQEDVRVKLQDTFIEGMDKVQYPLSHFMAIELVEDHLYITADKGGRYKNIYWNEVENPLEIQAALKQIAGKYGVNVDFYGQFYKNKEQMKQLLLIFILSVLLLYFILASQFESIVQPLIVLITLPLSLTGSLFALWLEGGNLNIMSGIGIIVSLGIIVNDSILKIDTMNRHYDASTFGQDNLTVQEKIKLLTHAVHQSSLLRLKPVLMTSLTTILALMPVLFTSGLGADLQRPLVYAVIGGLTIGTVVAVFYVPMFYWYIRVFQIKYFRVSKPKIKNSYD